MRREEGSEGGWEGSVGGAAEGSWGWLLKGAYLPPNRWSDFSCKLNNRRTDKGIPWGPQVVPDQKRIKQIQSSKAQIFIIHLLLAVPALLSEKEGKWQYNLVDYWTTFVLSIVFIYLLNFSLQCPFSSMKLSANWQTCLQGMSAVIWICPYQECTHRTRRINSLFLLRARLHKWLFNWLITSILLCPLFQQPPTNSS